MTSLRNIFAKKQFKNLHVIGVTGNVGKTTTVHMIHHALRHNGINSAYISTFGYGLDANALNTSVIADNLTKKSLQKILSNFETLNVQCVILEMKPELINKGIFNNINLDTGIITNSIQKNHDNLKTAQSFFYSQLKFTKLLKDYSLIVLNKNSDELISWLNANEHIVAQNIYAKIVDKSIAQNVEHYLDGVKFNISNQDFKILVPAEYNLENSVLSYSALEKYLHPSAIKDSFAYLENLPGRMQLYKVNPFRIIIDYAYTPEMLADALSHLNKFKTNNQKIVTIFGCAGERDESRRKMGSVAAKMSDVVVITAEDPKYENLENINSEIIKYAQLAGGGLIQSYDNTDHFMNQDLNYIKTKINDLYSMQETPIFAFNANDYSSRLDAVKFAVKIANPGDIIYITGKGHENSLSFNGVEYEWSEYDAVDIALGNL